MAEGTDTPATAVDEPTSHEFLASGRPYEGTRLGRYVVLGLLGKGGMGRVYRGYDPKLHREVAIKVLSEGGGEAATARLVREAQAMAQLSHPNVVPVYDVEAEQGRVFLAMELVEGQTLTSRLTHEHTPQEALALLIQAGRGLAAAHAVALVHRDFKPGNVMVGVDGRARVMDFGIARGSAEHDPPASETTNEPVVAARCPLDSLSAPLTRAGAVLGTPGYMAPEQHRGGPVDHRSDQFAFCVTLYQAIAGTRPFRTRKGTESYRAKTEEPPPLLEGVAKPVQLAVARGLSPEPGDRFESMDALLSELERRPGSNARRFVAVGAIGLTLAGGWGWVQWSRSQRAAACAEQAAVMDTVWNEDTRNAVGSAIERTGLGYAPTTAASTLVWLDRHALHWAEAKEASCRRASVENSWTAETLARANWCLTVHRTEFEALTQRLVQAEAVDAETAVERAASLAAVELCIDERVLAGLEVPPVDARDDLRGTLRTLARAGAMITSNEWDDGLTLARQALSEAEDLQSGPVAARAHLTIADALDAKGEFAEGTEARKRGYFAAMETSSPEIAGTAATALIFSTGVSLSHEQEALDWYRHAKIATRKAGLHADGLAAANAEFNIATVDFHAAKVDLATPRFESVLAIREPNLGASHPQVASVLNMLASSIARSGEFARARPLFERALAIQRSVYGDDHPAVATTLHNMATGLHVEGEFAEAAELYEQSLAIRERSLRPDHQDIGLSLNNLAGIAWELGDKRNSLEISQRALTIWESQYGLDHPRVANSLTGVAGTHVTLGEPEKAVPLLQRAVAIYDAHPRGPKSNEPTARLELAQTLVSVNRDLTTAREQAKRARILYVELGESGAATVAKIDALLRDLGQDGVNPR